VRLRIVVLVIHAGKRLQPARLGGVDQRLAVFAAVVAGRRRQLCQDRLGDKLGVATDADGDRLGEADAVGIDIDLDHLGVLRPVIDAVAGQRRKRIEPRTQGQHNVGLGDQLHRRLRAVVAERADGKAMAAREAVVVLVIIADRRIELFGERRAFGNGTGQNDSGARQDRREFRCRQKLRRIGDGLLAAGRALEFDDRR
jgi:hypothetical protein